MDAPKICVSTSGYGESIRTRVLVRPAGRGDSFQAGLTLRLADGEGAEDAFELAARYDASGSAAGPTAARSARKI